MTVFEAFKQTEYTYLTVSRGEVYGNRIESEKPDLMGVFKLRSGMTSANNMEARESSATLHIRPEDVADGDEIVGNGIRHDGKDYAIVGMSEGRNFAANAVEHYTLTLERTEYVDNDQAN